MTRLSHRKPQKRTFTQYVLVLSMFFGILRFIWLEQTSSWLVPAGTKWSKWVPALHELHWCSDFIIHKLRVSVMQAFKLWRLFRNTDAESQIWQVAGVSCWSISLTSSSFFWKPFACSRIPADLEWACVAKILKRCQGKPLWCTGSRRLLSRV